MTPLFVYGTLRHMPLLYIVLGADHGVSVEPDVLPDHAVYAVREGPFPMLAKAPGAHTEGLRLTGLTPQDQARLDFYEAGFDFSIETKDLSSGIKARTYVPALGWTPGALWSLDDWIAQWGVLSCETARDVMSRFGTLSAEQIAARFPRMRARAQSRLNAAQSRHGVHTLAGTFEATAERRHDGFFALDQFRITHQTFSGGQSGPHEREVFIAGDAALVLPYDPVTDRVLVVEQFRAGPMARGDQAVWQLEPVAGMIDPGETAQQAAIREAQEEAGLKIARLEPVAEGYASPGASTDFHYLYIGLCDISDASSGLHGLEAEGEDIRTHVLGFDQILTLAEDLRLANTPLLLAVYWLARHRDRLRSP